MHEYLKNHIMEELDDAVGYAKKAIDAKMDHPSWCSIFMRLSNEEAVHAQSLKKMYEENKEDTDYYKEGYKMIIEKFTSAMEEVEKVKTMLKYWD